MTATKQLIDDRLVGRSLDAVVSRMRRNGDGWRAIAREIGELTGVHVSSETVRRWYPKDRSDSAAKTSAA